MSFALPVVDLSAAVVDTTGTLSWADVAPQAGYSAYGGTPHLALYNESGCGLQIVLSTGEQFYLTAGGWQHFALNTQCASLTYKVVYTLSNPLVSSLLGTWYAPEEPVPAAPVLGNSPIGGTLSSSTAQLLQGAGQSQTLTEVDSGVTPSLAPITGIQTGLGLGIRDINGNFVLIEQTYWNGLPVIETDSFSSIYAYTNATLFVIGNPGTDTGLVRVNGHVTYYNGAATVGNGVPSIVTGTGTAGTHVTTTTASTLVFTTTAAAAMYRLNAWALVNNGTPGNNVTFTVSYTDAATGAARTDTIPLYFSTGTLFPSGGTSIANGHYLCPAVLLPTQASSSITVTYRDPTNTPNDYYFAALERLY